MTTAGAAPIIGTITFATSGDRTAEETPETAPRRRPGRPMARRRRGQGDEGPSTVRLDDEAKSALWDSFVTAKRADPFLTYTAHASEVVLAGLRESRS